MKKIKIFIIFIIINVFFINFSYSDTLELSVGTWEGDVKKGKAHGMGILTFKNGAVYEGKMKKNKVHGNGKLTTKDGEVFDGKWKRGKYYQKIDKTTRKVIILQTKGRFYWERIQMKGTGKLLGNWYSAEKKSDGTYVLDAKGNAKMLSDKKNSEGQKESTSSGC